MKLNIDLKSILAVLFLILAMAFLVTSVSTTQRQRQMQELADQEIENLIPSAKAPIAADFEATDLSGHRFKLSEAVKHGPVIVSFWATWCRYCPLEMADLDRYAKDYRGRLQIYTIDSDDSPEAITRFMTAHRFSLPTLIDKGHCAAALYGATSLPHLFMIDRQGRIRYIGDGYSPDMNTYYPKLLKRLVLGTQP